MFFLVYNEEEAFWGFKHFQVFKKSVSQTFDSGSFPLRSETATDPWM